MKVIDLLNKIANGEEVPEKIKVFGGIYYLCKGDNSKQLYFSEKQGYGGFSLKFKTSQINDEVEIIEEDNKIENIKTYFDEDVEEYIAETKLNGVEHKVVYGDGFEQMIVDKINQIIDVINEIKNEN